MHETRPSKPIPYLSLGLAIVLGMLLLVPAARPLLGDDITCYTAPQERCYYDCSTGGPGTNCYMHNSSPVPPIDPEG